ALRIPGDAGALATQVGSLNPNAGGVARAALRRGEVVEDSIESAADLIQSSIGEHVRLGNSDVAAVVLNMFGTAEGTLLRKPRRTAAGHKRSGLVVAETREGTVII